MVRAERFVKQRVGFEQRRLGFVVASQRGEALAVPFDEHAALPVILWKHAPRALRRSPRERLRMITEFNVSASPLTSTATAWSTERTSRICWRTGRPRAESG